MALLLGLIYRTGLSLLIGKESDGARTIRRLTLQQRG
jgi:hypothetical protein